MNAIIDLRRVTDLGSEFVTLAEAKTQLRVTFSDDNTEITALIKKARRHLENHLNISIVYQRIQLIAYLESEWKLPYGPVIGLESVSSSSGPSGSAPISYSPVDNYSIDGDLFGPWGGGIGNPNLFTERLSGCHPQSAGIRHKIVYTAGNFCPDDLKDVMLQVITFLYENRGKDTNITGLKEVLSNADNYLVPLWV